MVTVIILYRNNWRPQSWPSYLSELVSEIESEAVSKACRGWATVSMGAGIGSEGELGVGVETGFTSLLPCIWLKSIAAI